MNIPQHEDDELMGEEMGVEVVGIPRRKNKRGRSFGRKPSHPTAADTNAASVSNRPDYMMMPHLETRDHVLEISLQEIPSAPPVVPKVPRVKHQAGTVLEPPASLTGFVRPAMKRKKSRSDEIIHVDGDPFPPCFRVVGVSPTPEEQEHHERRALDNNKSPSERSIKKLPIPPTGTSTSTAANTSAMSTLTDERSVDDNLVAKGSGTGQYLQLDLPGMQKRQESALSTLSSHSDMFRDEEAVAPVDANNQSVDPSNASSHYSKTTTRDYLAMTQQLVKERKQTQQREAEKQRKGARKLDSASRASHSRSSKPPEKEMTTAPSWKSPGMVFALAALLVGVSLTGFILIMTLGSFQKKEDQNSQANAIVQDPIIDTSATTSPTDLVVGLTTSAPAPTPPVIRPTPGVENTIESLQLEDFPASTAQILAGGDQSAPQVRAYQWLLQDPYLSNYPKWQQFQRMALATLYYATSGEQWKGPAATSWLSYDGSECQFYSQACDSHGHVRRLFLSDSGLDGTLPPELFWLTSLQQIQLFDNPQLRGPIPTLIGRLTDLQVLWLQRCGFSSTYTMEPAIPSEIGRLGSSLLYMDVSHNPLGHAADSNGSSNNDLNGATLRDYPGSSHYNNNDIPTEIGLLTRLQELILTGSRLVGTLPSEIGNLGQLQYSLQVSQNGLSGTLPLEFSRLSLLENFFADNNHVSGHLPALEMKSLKILDLSNNHLEGSLPAFTLMDGLEELWLFDNLLSGAIGVLPTSLVSLDLSMNQLTRLPLELGSLSNLNGLWVYSNSIFGTIPASLGQLHANLLQLSLFGNRLSGTIPTELESLTRLRGLWLDDCNLVGTIPENLLALTSLVALHLYDNRRLQGTIPRSPSQTYYAMAELFLHNTAISGTVPAELERLTNLQRVTLHKTFLSSEVPPEVCGLFGVKLESLSIDCSEVFCSCGCTCV
ncbi:Leucine Rich Repeat [Seminavis robusta]|uniref:Leucine Rich Repeat n=1 Tax=Seminavis robusta TaxID=568900 RepID=A0A9N8F581_9STRA|nr:Leucine Rich Repeat [Seminavis robusta]|eukprot:Sro3195_g344980.1 Leucine Rich Repeat (941) ;mRNA; f:2049-4871